MRQKCFSYQIFPWYQTEHHWKVALATDSWKRTAEMVRAFQPRTQAFSTTLFAGGTTLVQAMVTCLPDRKCNPQRIHIQRHLTHWFCNTNCCYSLKLDVFQYLLKCLYHLWDFYGFGKRLESWSISSKAFFHLVQ